jgi:hypothetical protein
MIFDLFPQPIGLGHISQIKEGPLLRPLYRSMVPAKFCLGFDLNKQTSNQDPIVVHCWKQTLVGTPSKQKYELIAYSWFI